MVFDLKDSNSWDPIFSEILISNLGLSYVDTLKSNSDKIIYRDSEFEGCSLFSNIIDRMSLILELKTAMCSYFEWVITYHACRTDNIDTYYEKGILPLSEKNAQKKFRDYLKKIGKATIFVCKISFSEIDDLEDLTSTLLADHFFRMAHTENEVVSVDHTITKRESVPSSSILRHYNPVKIRDPYKQSCVWNDETMSYESPTIG